MIDGWVCNHCSERGIISPHPSGVRRNDMSKLCNDSTFIACLALLFATLATASTVLALFQPGLMALA